MPVIDGIVAMRHTRTFEQEQSLRPVFILAITGVGSVSGDGPLHDQAALPLAAESHPVRSSACGLLWGVSVLSLELLLEVSPQILRVFENLVHYIGETSSSDLAMSTTNSSTRLVHHESISSERRTHNCLAMNVEYLEAGITLGLLVNYLGSVSMPMLALARMLYPLTERPEDIKISLVFRRAVS